MRLFEITSKIPQIHAGRFLAINGDIYKVTHSNFDSYGQTSNVVLARKVKRMYVAGAKLYAFVGGSTQRIPYEQSNAKLVSDEEAYDIYQLKRGYFKKLAQHAIDKDDFFR